MNNSTVGYSKAIITPPFGTPLAGYNCERTAKSVHDNLYVRVVALRAEETFLLVQLDLLSADAEYIHRLCGSLHELYGTDENKVFVSCIHTHSGPIDEVPKGTSFLDKMSVKDGPVAQCIMKQIIWCAGKALDNLCPFTFSPEKTRLQGVGLNRRNPSIPMDDSLLVISLNRTDGKQIIIYNYACHPTIMNSANEAVTADYPGQAAAVLESQDSVACAVFLNGACGDVSTRFTRRESTFAEVRRIGNILGGETLKLANMKGTDENVHILKSGICDVTVALKPILPLTDAEAVVKKALSEKESAEKQNLSGGRLRVIQSAYEGSVINLEITRAMGSLKTIMMQIKVLRINEVYLVYIPGELFAALALKLKEAFPKSCIAVVCYGNGFTGYIPDLPSYEQGGYETLSTLFAPGESEKMIDRIAGLISSMN